MGKKSNTKYLLIAVILIYAAIIVRFFMLRSDSDEAIDSINPVAQFTPVTYESKETFTIENNHRDPFLGKLPNKAPRRKTQQGKVVPPKEPAYFPLVQYRGIVSDTQSNKKVISLVINDKEFVVREGSIVDSVRVISGSANKLAVSYKGRKKEIPISQ
jgi:hypothetical protein